MSILWVMVRAMLSAIFTIGMGFAITALLLAKGLAPDADLWTATRIVWALIGGLAQ